MVVVAVVFMLTSLSLAILAKEKTFSSTVIDLKKKKPLNRYRPLQQTNRQPIRTPPAMIPPPLTRLDEPSQLFLSN